MNIINLIHCFNWKTRMAQNSELSGVNHYYRVTDKHNIYHNSESLGMVILI